MSRFAWEKCQLFFTRLVQNRGSLRRARNNQPLHSTHDTIPAFNRITFIASSCKVRKVKCVCMYLFTQMSGLMIMIIKMRMVKGCENGVMMILFLSVSRLFLLHLVTCCWSSSSTLDMHATNQPATTFILFLYTNVTPGTTISVLQFIIILYLKMNEVLFLLCCAFLEWNALVRFPHSFISILFIIPFFLPSLLAWLYVCRI